MFLFNLYKILFGSKDIEELKKKVSLKKYTKEINEAMVESVGKDNAKVLKLVLTAFIALSLLVNYILMIQLILAIILGSYGARKLYSIPAASNVLNKITIYIRKNL